ncbi:MAG: 3'(2'),5'-bisphosphate nucleotidase [Gammaproteobacteria bacterium]|nr:MAG: 3'(2'),5'-bisphosphate nucleotidase [Gammaproteobacteria bacterium]RLA14623.1 MAG: 3'(2'),5'-bisphosphate nucleotidase [Gammaproteobacteria bacterium]
MKLEEYCNAATQIAVAAGQQILEVYGDEFAVEYKADESPLTLADQRSHDVIVAGLQALGTGLPILSEEGDMPDFASRSQWSQYWLLDPLDGTKEFVKRNGEFTVNIALVDAGVPVLGVVYVPVTGVTYFAWAGGGSWRQESGETPEKITVRQAAPDGCLAVVCSRSHRGARLEALLQRLGNYEAVPMGSSLKLCLVAEGLADFYPRLGPTSEWDTAAAHAVVLEAGGQVTDLQRLPLLYNQKESLLNPEFLVMPAGHPDWLPDFDNL